MSSRTDLLQGPEAYARLKRLFDESEQVAKLGSWEWCFPSGQALISNGLYRVYGIEPGRFNGSYETILSRFHPDDRPLVETSRERTITSGEPFSLDARIVRMDGQLRFVHMRGEVFSDSDDGSVRIIGVTQDISDRKLLEQRLRTQLEQLQELDRLKTEFVNLVSHELRTPLTATRGYLEFLEEGVGGELSTRQKEYVKHIETGMLRLERLVDDLLDVARIDAGTFALRLAEGDLRASLHEIVESLRPLAADAGVRLEEVLPQAPLRVRCDPQRISQVVGNFISNAVKFSPPGGTVLVRLCADDGQLRCEVSDHGEGIEPREIPRLFQRFSQLGAGIRKGGTGLGLYISKQIVQAHGGAIGVESRPDEGSTFWFSLPLQPIKPPDAKLT